MKVEIEIADERLPDFIELMKANNFITDMNEVEKKRKALFVKGLTQSFKEVKLYKEGKKDLKDAKELIDELRSKSH